MAGHAVLSPSGAHRWGTCPGSVVLEKGCEDKGSDYADEGTAAHFLAEQCLRTGMKASDLLGCTISIWGSPEGDKTGWAQDSEGRKPRYTLAVSDDIAAFVQTYVDYVRDLVASTGGALLVEERLGLEFLTGEKNAAGTSDVVIVSDDELIIVDLKYGRGVEVSAEKNTQLMTYASAAREVYSCIAPFKRVRVCISQPRVSSAPSEYVISMEDLDTFEGKTRDAVARVKEAVKAADVELDEVLSYLNPSDKACKWCKAKAKCPALAALVAEKSRIQVPDDLPGKMAVIDLVAQWCKSVEAEVYQRLQNGEVVQGYKLVQGKKGNRQWGDENAVADLVKKLKLKKEEMYDSKLISPAAAEKKFGKEEKTWAPLQELIVQKEGSLTIASLADARAAVTVDPLEGFDVITA